MELIEQWEIGLSSFVSLAKLILESISVFCVVVGLFKTLQAAIKLRFSKRSRDEFPFNQVRILFGTWLALALEFQLGADVLATTVTPTLQELSKLAIIAIVRTFLNYFLNKELEAELEIENTKREHERQQAQTYAEAQQPKDYQR
jgi:uncharacterized membrane protein